MRVFQTLKTALSRAFTVRV